MISVLRRAGRLDLDGGKRRGMDDELGTRAERALSCRV